MSSGTLSGAWSAPASTSTTLFPGYSESRAAITQPAEPPPITRCVACISLSPSFESLSPLLERTVHPILVGGNSQTNRLAGHLMRVADINEAHAAPLNTASWIVASFSDNSHPAPSRPFLVAKGAAP